jgi:hypothetical protein
MPQPDSSRHRPIERGWNETDAPWPVDSAAPRPFAAHLRPRSAHSKEKPPAKEKPEQDGRTPDDRDGNEELERQEEEKPASRRASTERGEAPASARARWDFETEDTGEWVATERFTLDDELDDTWPNVPSRYLDD